MFVLEISADDIRVAREKKSFPVVVAFERQYAFTSVRANPVCALLQRCWSPVWIKVRFPDSMWDWGMTFYEGGDVEPITLHWPDDFDGQESVLLDPYVRDFRGAARMDVDVVVARCSNAFNPNAVMLPGW